VSSLWTPSGEHVPSEQPPGGTDAPGGRGAGGRQRPDGPSDEELAALRELHHQLFATPVEDVVANHAAGLLQLALVLLGLATPPDDQGRVPAPDLAKASVAIDALAALVEGLGPRLGAHEGPLREAVAQVQTAYVQVTDALDAAQAERGAGPERAGDAS
jgi:hypothetical protein